MTNLREDHRIIAMNGYPHVDTGRARAIVAREDVFFKSGNSPRLWPLSSLEEFASSRRVTLLEPPLTPSWLKPSSADDAIVVYLSDSVKEHAPSALGHPVLHDASWSSLTCGTSALSATCLTSRSADIFLRVLAGDLFVVVSKMLRRLLRSHDASTAELVQQLAHASLSAATTPYDRYTAFVRYAATLRACEEDDALRNLYEAFVCREFTGTTQRDFTEATAHFLSRFDDDEVMTSAAPKLIGIAELST